MSKQILIVAKEIKQNPESCVSLSYKKARLENCCGKFNSLKYELGNKSKQKPNVNGILQFLYVFRNISVINLFIKTQEILTRLTSL